MVNRRQLVKAPHQGMTALAIFATACLGSAAQAQDTLPSFADWRQKNEAELANLEAHLATQGVADVVPLHQLLRSATSWATCHHEAYAIPPQAQWRSVVSVLQLVRRLKETGVIGDMVVHSGYRNPALNACAAGAPRSAHLMSFALDFTPVTAEDITPKLCEFWLAQGRAWNMGLSRYPSGRIHVDTAGYRTWGADHMGGSAACLSPAASRVSAGP